MWLWLLLLLLIEEESWVDECTRWDASTWRWWNRWEGEWLLGVEVEVLRWWLLLLLLRLLHELSPGECLLRKLLLSGLLLLGLLILLELGERRWWWEGERCGLLRALLCLRLWPGLW